MNASPTRARRLSKLVVWLAVESLVLSSLAGVTVGHEVGWLAGIVTAAACVWLLLRWVHRRQVDELLGSSKTGDRA